MTVAPSTGDVHISYS